MTRTIDQIEAAIQGAGARWPTLTAKELKRKAQTKRRRKVLAKRARRSKPYLYRTAAAYLKIRQLGA